jgi:hypothetical protein
MRKIKKKDNTLGDIFNSLRLALIGFVDDMDESTLVDFKDVKVTQEDGWYNFSMSFKKYDEEESGVIA